jgi:hypothetical protein
MIHPSNVVVFPGLPSFNLDMEAIEAEFGVRNMRTVLTVPMALMHKLQKPDLVVQTFLISSLFDCN